MNTDSSEEHDDVLKFLEDLHIPINDIPPVPAEHLPKVSTSRPPTLDHTIAKTITNNSNTTPKPVIAQNIYFDAAKSSLDGVNEIVRKEIPEILVEESKEKRVVKEQIPLQNEAIINVESSQKPILSNQRSKDKDTIQPEKKDPAITSIQEWSWGDVWSTAANVTKQMVETVSSNESVKQFVHTGGQEIQKIGSELSNDLHFVAKSLTDRIAPLPTESVVPHTVVWLCSQIKAEETVNSIHDYMQLISASKWLLSGRGFTDKVTVNSCLDEGLNIQILNEHEATIRVQEVFLKLSKLAEPDDIMVVVMPFMRGASHQYMVVLQASRETLMVYSQSVFDNADSDLHVALAAYTQDMHLLVIERALDDIVQRFRLLMLN